MTVSRVLQSLFVAGALLCGAIASVQATPISGIVHLDADVGNHVWYEVSNAATWRHGIDGELASYDHVSRASDGVNMFFVRDQQTWLMQFSAPRFNPLDQGIDGQALQVGLYDNVNGDWRYEPERAGMLISSPFGMAVEWSGWFRVLDIAYGLDGNLSRFAVDFMQFDTSNQSGPALRGSLRFNSAIPLPGVNVPEPAPAALLLAGLAMLALARRRRP